MFTHLTERNTYESQNKTLRLSASLEKLGSNATNNIHLKQLVVNIRTEYDDQINQLTSTLNEVVSK